MGKTFRHNSSSSIKPGKFSDKKTASMARAKLIVHRRQEDKLEMRTYYVY